MIKDGRLLLGGCRFNEGPVQKTFPNEGPILIVDKWQGLFLCRAEPSVRRTNSLSPSICFDDGAQVLPWNSDEESGENSLVDLVRNDMREYIKIHLENDATGGSCQQYVQKHKHAIISNASLNLSDKGSSFCCYSTKSPARPLISITLRLHSTVNPGSLTLTRTKRGLSGLYIAFIDGRLTTNVKLAYEKSGTEEICSVESVTARSSAGKGFWYWILPSTMITILPSEPPNGSSQLPAIGTVAQRDSTRLSAVAQNLIHLVRGLRMRAGSLNSCLLSGPPGVGKTHAVREAYEICRKEDHTLLLSLGLLIGSEENPNQICRLLSRSFEMAAAACKKQKTCVAILFIDECDALLSSQVVAGMLSSLLDRMAQGSENWKRLLIVGATNTVESIPSYLRFETEIVVAPPTAEERFYMLNQLLDNSTNLFALGLKTIQNLSEDCVGYVAADLVAVVRRAVTLALVSNSEFVDEEMFRSAMADTGASALRESSLLTPPETSWDDIAGQVVAKKTLRQAIEWPISKKEKINCLGLHPPKGILMYGPPGCAKTTIAKAGAGAAGAAFLAFSPSDVYSSSYVGEAEKTVRDAFKKARSVRPCILFFDEIDAIVGSESNDNHHGMNRSTMSAESRVLSTFLNEMDGVDGSSEDGVIVLAATNRPWTLDKALLRSGRFDHAIYVPPPTQQGRLSIFKMFCNSDISVVDLEDLARDEVSGSMTGAEIVGACRAAGVRALKRAIETQQSSGGAVRVTLDDLKVSLSATKPVLTQPGYFDAFLEFERNRLRS